jgi:hypothetical protein
MRQQSKVFFTPEADPALDALEAHPAAHVPIL